VSGREEDHGFFLHGGRKEIFTVTVLKNEWLRFTCADMA
jgi:hypothetical protein